MYVSLPSITTVRSWFSTIGYNGEIGAKGTLKKSYLPSSNLLAAASLSSSTQISKLLTNMTNDQERIGDRFSLCPFPLSPSCFILVLSYQLKYNSQQVDYAKLIWEDLIHKLNKKTRENIVPYPRFISLLLEHMMPEYDNEELTINLTQDKSPSHPSPPTPVVGEMHKEAQQAAGGPTSLGATSEEDHTLSSVVCLGCEEKRSCEVKISSEAKTSREVKQSFDKWKKDVEDKECNKEEDDVLEEINVIAMSIEENDMNERNELWKDLEIYKKIIRNEPWFLSGDLNVTLKPSEHSASGSNMSNDMKDFHNYVNQIEVEDISSSGSEEADMLKMYTKAMKDEEHILFQKAKVKWLSVGDINNAYFHKTIKSRQQRNIIDVVCDDNVNRFEGADVADQFVRQFQKFLGENKPMEQIRDMETLFQHKLSNEEAEYMIREVNDEEIKNAMFQIDDNKASGPDGYSTSFFKKTWSIIGKDVCLAVNFF
ncbi:hypothetical protein Tco_0864635 [Tanacetum coccineum]